MRYIPFFLLIFCVACQKPIEKDTWQLVYKNDANGQAVFGNKQELIDAVRSGKTVKIGFGGQLRSDTTLTLEHVFEAQFFTILNDNEVYAQMLPIIGQNPLIEKDTTNIIFRETHWNILVGTNGFSDRITMSLSKDSVLGHNQRNMNISWFIKRKQEGQPSVKALWRRD